MKMNFFASETGYYEFEGHTGPSPEITVKIGETVTFDQTDPSNWYHPVGFAYEPDGAHGSTWGGEELDEVDGFALCFFYLRVRTDSNEYLLLVLNSKTWRRYSRERACQSLPKLARS